MRVQDIMLRDLPILPPHTSLRQAAAQMADDRRRLLVVANEKEVLGLLTLRHLVLGAEAAAQGHAPLCAADVASTRFILTAESESSAALARRMVEAGVRRAVVVDGEQAVRGVITPWELARGERRRRRSACVDVASEDSFPASDPPSWTATIAG